MFFLPLLCNFLKELISQEDTQNSPPNKRKWKRRNVTIHSRSQRATREKPSTSEASAPPSTKAALPTRLLQRGRQSRQGLLHGLAPPYDSQTDGFWGQEDVGPFQLYSLSFP